MDLTSERPKESPERKPDNSWGAGGHVCAVVVAVLSTVVQHGGGDPGPIGCVSIKSCHNSCRGIITECVEAGRGAVGEIGEKGDF